MDAITRKEKILDGQDLTPITRMEYFLKKAVSGGTDNLIIRGVGDAAYISEDNTWVIPVDINMNDIVSALNSGRTVYCRIPTQILTTSPYYIYDENVIIQLPVYSAGIGGAELMVPETLILGEYEISHAELSATEGSVTLNLY